VIRRSRLSAGFAIAILLAAGTSPVSAQAQVEVGAQLITVASSEFDDHDIGVGGRIAWRPTTLIGVEGELGVYPGNFPDSVSFSSGRIEGLFGVTAGPALGRVRPFARLRPGFLTFREAPAPFACILIFPPPLACTLASGRTSFALDVGGGVEIEATPRTFVRVDAGDRLLRYPGPAFDGSRQVHSEAFFGHDIRVAVGGGFRF
jgi:hypothetical protein